jgi:hypothetical protein
MYTRGRSTSNSSTSSTNSKRSRNHSFSPIKDKLPNNNSKKIKTKPNIMEAALKELQTTVALILKNQQEDKMSLNKIDTILEKQLQLSNTVQTIVDDVKKINIQVNNHEENFTSINADLKIIHSNINSMSSELNKVKQKGISNHFSLHGIPSTSTKENALNIMTKVYNKIGINFNSNDFKSIYFVKSKNKDFVYINGEFFDSRNKQFVMEKFKQHKPIFVEDVCTIGDDNPLRGKEVWIRNLLIPEFRKLLNEARQLAPGFKFIWENKGRILMRKEEGSPIIEISSHHQLVQLISNNQS